MPQHFLSLVLNFFGNPEVHSGINSLRFLRKILAQQAVRILVGSALQRAIQMDKVQGCIQAACGGVMVRKFEGFLQKLVQIYSKLLILVL